MRKPASRPQSRKEQAVNRLLTRVQSLRDQLERDRRRLDEDLAFHVAHVRPREQSLAALRTEMVRALRTFMDDTRLQKADRRALRAIVGDLVDEILAVDASPHEEIQELFEELHGIALEQAAREQLEEMREDMAGLFRELGFDMEMPDLRLHMTDEEVAATAAEMADRLRQAAEAHAAPRPARRTSKREVQAEERARRVEHLQKISIGAVYKRLVKTLHPDLERDAGVRERKSAAMQDVTAAYARSDLHTLLRLEHEWVDGGQGDAATLAGETLDAYVHVLKQQVAELRAECMQLPFDPRYEPLTVEGPFGVPVLLDGPAEVQRLELLIEGLRAGLDRIAAGKGLQEVRAQIRAHCKAARISKWQ